MTKQDIAKQLKIEHYDHGRAEQWRIVNSIFKYALIVLCAFVFSVTLVFVTSWHDFFSNSPLAPVLRWLGVL